MGDLFAKYYTALHALRHKASADFTPVNRIDTGETVVLARGC